MSGTEPTTLMVEVAAQAWLRYEGRPFAEQMRAALRAALEAKDPWQCARCDAPCIRHRPEGGAE